MRTASTEWIPICVHVFFFIFRTKIVYIAPFILYFMSLSIVFLFFLFAFSRFFICAFTFHCSLSLFFSLSRLIDTRPLGVDSLKHLLDTLTSVTYLFVAEHKLFVLCAIKHTTLRLESLSLTFTLIDVVVVVVVSCMPF